MEFINFSLKNHLLLIFKFLVYRSRKTIHVNILQLNSAINKIKDFELKASENKPGKCEKYYKKWEPFYKHCKTNGAWLGAKVNGWVIFFLSLFVFLLFFLSFVMTRFLFCFCVQKLAFNTNIVNKFVVVCLLKNKF